MRKAVPALLCIANGSFPGYEFVVWIARVVRCGEVKRIRSLGSGTKPVGSSSITQLSTRWRSFFSMLVFCGFDTIYAERQKQSVDVRCEVLDVGVQCITKDSNATMRRIDSPQIHSHIHGEDVLTL